MEDNGVGKQVYSDKKTNEVKIMKQFLLVLILLSSVISYSQKRPNILWIVTEDISPELSMYGDSTANTPNLDKLAAESMIYDNAFATVAVCAPARSSIITGMYPTTIGTMHMRTGKDVASWGKREYKNKIEIVDLNGDTICQYSTVIPDYVKCFPEYLRAEGYFCTNNSKTDYQFAAPLSAWDENSNKAHWRNRPENTPFFSVFNINVTHESRLWVNKNKKLTVSPNDVEVPPYLVDNEITRNDIARHYSNIELMDAKVATIINQLKEDGLYDNTIIFFYSDHGGPLPREKRATYDSGLKVPFFVKDINSSKIGRTDRLISFVDLAPTILSLASIKPPKHIQGAAFLGKYEAKERQYVFASSDRFDEITDRSRVIRTKRFLYVKNYFPDLQKYKDVAYRKQIPMMKEMLRLKERGELNKMQMIWFGKKTEEELYNVENDPHNMNNLVNAPNYNKALNELRGVYSKHKKENTDLGMMPEAQLIEKMWPDYKQPKTEKPVVKQNSKGIILSTPTKGASISFLVSDKPDQKFDFDANWQLYNKPLKLKKGGYLYVISERIGYQQSDVVIKKVKR